MKTQNMTCKHMIEHCDCCIGEKHVRLMKVVGLVRQVKRALRNTQDKIGRGFPGRGRMGDFVLRDSNPFFKK